MIPRATGTLQNFHIELNSAQQLEYFARTHTSLERVKSLALDIRRQLGFLRYPHPYDVDSVGIPGLDEVKKAVQCVLDEFSALEPNPGGDVPVKRVLDKISDVTPFAVHVRESARLLAAEYEGRREEDEQRARYPQNPYSQIERDLDALQIELEHAYSKLTSAETVSQRPGVDP